MINNLELDIQDCILQVKVVMPNLRHLEISLSREEDVSFIIENLKNLETLNKIAVEWDQLLDDTDEGAKGFQGHIEN